MRNNKRVISLISVLVVLAMAVMVFAACGLDANYKQKLEKAGYTVVEAKEKADEEEAVVKAWAITSKDAKIPVTILEYKNAKLAKAAVEAYEKSDAKQIGSHLAGLVTGTKVVTKNKGKLVYVGLETSVDAVMKI